MARSTQIATWGRLPACQNSGRLAICPTFPCRNIIGTGQISSQRGSDGREMGSRKIYLWTSGRLESRLPPWDRETRFLSDGRDHTKRRSLLPEKSLSIAGVSMVGSRLWSPTGRLAAKRLSYPSGGFVAVSWGGPSRYGRGGGSADAERSGHVPTGQPH